MNVTRRQFLGTTALSGLCLTGLETQADAKTGMPTRVLGRTGIRVPVIAMGGGSRLLAYKVEDKALEAMEKAINLGINYLDSAAEYGDGKSEQWVGKLMPTRRKDVILVTKTNQRTYDTAMRQIERSLKYLQVDKVDLLHIHSLLDEATLAAIEAKDGALGALLKLRDQKVARAIGVTCHSDPTVLAKALERHDFDCVQMALNAAKAGMKNGPRGMIVNEALKTSFETVALPIARRKKMGILAMKIFAQDDLVGKAPIEKLIRYTLSLPVSAAVLGMPKLEFLDENARVAKSFKPLPAAEMKQLSGELAAKFKMAIDRRMANHVDS